MNKKQKIMIVGAALFAALFLFSGIMLARQYADSKQSADAFDAVAAYTGSNLPAARRISARWPEKTCHPAGRVRQ